MANLPDIDTKTVGYLAYWNAIDQGGVSDIDPTDVTSDDNIEEYTLYDNGLEGGYDLTPAGREAEPESVTGTFRVKEDGWVVVYLDDTDTFERATNSFDANGHYDVFNWQTGETNTGVRDSVLFGAIDSLRQEFSNSGQMAFAQADCGLYNYVYPDATLSTTLSSRSVSGSSSPRFAYTDTTDLLYAAALGTAYTDAGAGGPAANTSFEGLPLAAVNADGEQAWGTVDALAEGLIPDGGTEYGHDTDESADSGLDGYTQSSVVFIIG